MTHVIFQTDISSCHLRDIQDGLPHRAANLGDLEYRSIRFERQIFADIGPGYYQSSSVVNYPGLEFNFTRIVEYKHFLNQKSKHTLIVKEFSSDEGDPYYPVPNQRNRELYARYKKLAVKEEKEKGVYFVGRLANYKYFNMDQAIDNALNTFNRIEHSPEQTDLQECWTSGLSAGLISLVSGTNSASQLAANTVTSWLRNFSATTASVHVYYRSTLARRLHRNSLSGGDLLGCGMQLSEHMLTPNRGNEAAVFLAYIVQHYKALPEMVIFIHDHGARSWHSEPAIFFRRLQAYLKGIQTPQNFAHSKQEAGTDDLNSKFAEKVRTLSSCYHEGPDTRNPFCVQHLPKRQLLDAPGAWRLAYTTFEGILNQSGASDTNNHGQFWSCCASFVARRQHIHLQPLTFYKHALDAILYVNIPAAVSGRWWEYNWYRIMRMQDQSIEDLQLYLKIDGQVWPKDSLGRLLNGRPFSEGFNE